MDIKGEAFDLDLATQTLTPATLRVTPQWSKPVPEFSTEARSLLPEIVKLEKQLPGAEADAIGKRIFSGPKRVPDAEFDSALRTYRDELQRAVDKHMAEGPLPPRRMTIDDQLEQLRRQLPTAEVEAVQSQALAKPFKNAEQMMLWKKVEFEKLLAKHKAEGTLVRPDSAAAEPTATAQSAGPSAAVRTPESWQDQLSRLTSELPGDEVQQVLVDARLNGPADVAKQREWVKRRLEKLIAKHKADGTLRKPNADDAAPTADPESLVTEILHLGLQLPEDEVKHVWAEARRKETDTVKQRIYVKDQLEKLIAKHKADGSLPKPKPDSPDSK
jgi:hypothetical protein